MKFLGNIPIKKQEIEDNLVELIMTKHSTWGFIENHRSTLILSYLLWICQLATAANVLAVFPSVWKSHYLFGRSLLEQMVTHNNHTVTLISGYTSTKETKFIREIEINGIQKNWMEMGLSFQMEQIREKSILERFTKLIYAGVANADLLLSDKKVHSLLRSKEKFDLLIVDLFLSDSLLGFSAFYKIPTIAVSPNGGNTWLNQMAGNPHNSALDPSVLLPFLEKMTTWERLINTLMGIFETLTYNFFHVIDHEVVYKKHFKLIVESTHGTELPHHRALAQNLSILLINSHPALQYSRAYLPNIIEIGGAHLESNVKPILPGHLRQYIEKAKDGVIYMSLGANVLTSDMPREKLDSFIHVFETLENSMKVILKWETDLTDWDLPPNVMLGSWFPQKEILAHKNVKIFITSGGLMSTIEAVHYHTPMIVIPIFPDQEATAKRLQNHGSAIHLPFEMISYDLLMKSINEILLNNSFMENINRLAFLLDSTSMVESPQSKALQYIEMVLKTSGASHLKSYANQLNFIKIELVDVLLIILAGICSIIAEPSLIICCILRKSYNSYVSNVIKMRNSDFIQSLSSDVQILARRRSVSTSSSTASSSTCSFPNCETSHNPIRSK